MLEVREVSVRYGKHQALDRVSLTVAPGEIVVMRGANGAGKSSFLKALGGMVKPLPGARATLSGVDLMQLAPHPDPAARRALAGPSLGPRWACRP